MQLEREVDRIEVELPHFKTRKNNKNLTSGRGEGESEEFGFII